jgi:hypothetical protein
MYVDFIFLTAWSSGIVSACGVMGREIESPHGVGSSFLKKKKKDFYDADLVLNESMEAKNTRALLLFLLWLD